MVAFRPQSRRGASVRERERRGEFLERDTMNDHRGEEPRSLPGAGPVEPPRDLQPGLGSRPSSR